MFKTAFCYLYDRPHVGFFSGIGSFSLAYIPDFLTNEHVLKVVAGIGAYAGVAVALLSIPPALLRNYKEFRNLKKDKSNP
jgi:hypothetical protein